MNIRALLLAAGLGTRLHPLTKIWPKCLMPINGRPLLEYWLYALKFVGIDEVLINTHYFQQEFETFLHQFQNDKRIETDYEPSLLGTAGTLRKHLQYFEKGTTLLVHADNFCQCDFNAFIEAHQQRPSGALITMMTFTTPTPHSCGIIELDDRNLVQELHEKVENPPGNKANAAVYLIEPEVLSWLGKQPTSVNDFSVHVLPNFLGKIATWHNDKTHIDIGTTKSLKSAQSNVIDLLPPNQTTWQQSFLSHLIQEQVNNL